ncbi:FlaD/FlaE family flagellar protein [Methanolobus sp. ZRKC2]|uniref:FlaD/FlaE family flagellar protein n=1 Tax=Methanolobus sp. ZRKC2 TaxID=3125783 RepID=UPI00324F344D
MSEFPWEVKKDSSKESSNEEKSGPDNSVSAEKKSEQSIPDILANAFASSPMEEATLENLPSSDPVFDNSPTVVETPIQPPGNLPPFMQASSTVEEGNEDVESSVPPSFSLDEISFGLPGAETVPQKDLSAPKKEAKKSPPPLFVPVLPGEEVSVPTKSELHKKMPEPAYVNVPEESPAFSPEAPSIEENAAPVNPFPEQNPISGDQIQKLFSPQEVSLQEKEPDLKNSFSETPFSPETPPGQAPLSENPFSDPMPNFNGPLPDYVAPSSNSFSDPSPVSTNPNQNLNPSENDPFLSSVGTSEDTKSYLAKDSENPFSDSVPPSADPFPGSAPISDDPFSGSLQQSANPFPDFPSNTGNPFSGQDSSSAAHSASPGLIGSIGSSVKVGNIIGSFNGVSEKVKSLLTGLTRGQSLIERMDGLTGGVDIAEEQNNSSPFDEASSFNMPVPQAEPPAAEQVFPPVGPAIPEPKDDVKNEINVVSPFDETIEQSVSQEIRTITPVTEPLMELKEEQKIDFSALENFENSEVLSPDQRDDISEVIPVDPQEKEVNSISPMSSLSLNDIGVLSDDCKMSDDLACPDVTSQAATISEDELAQVGQMSSDIQCLRSELEEMLSRFEDVEGNVSDLSENVSGFGPLLSTIENSEGLLASTGTKVDSLDGKVDALEGKVSGLENALVSVQSDNEDIRSSLTRIEESVSELVNSYTALLVQMHESAQENDSRFLQFESRLEMLDPIESRLSVIEKIQEESRSTSLELARSVSSLVDELGATSSGLGEFKESCELWQDKFEKNLDSVTEYLDSELKKIGARSYKGFGQNVHLSNIMKNSTNMKLCMEWLEFLMGLVGRNNLPDILSYYEDLGWLTEDVRVELMHYAEGIDFYMEKPDWKLTPDDHVKSIWFIESLAGMKVDKNKLSVIDRDIEKVKKGNEIYGI